MKNRLILSLLAGTISLVISCNDGSDPGPNIVGSWKLLTSELFDCDVATDNKVYTCGQYGLCETVTFNSDKTFVSVRSWDGAALGNGTYTLKDGHLFLSFAGSTALSEYIISVSGGTMIRNSVNSNSSCSEKSTFEKQ